MGFRTHTFQKYILKDQGLSTDSVVSKHFHNKVSGGKYDFFCDGLYQGYVSDKNSRSLQQNSKKKWKIFRADLGQNARFSIKMDIFEEI